MLGAYGYKRPRVFEACTTIMSQLAVDKLCKLKGGHKKEVVFVSGVASYTGDQVPREREWETSGFKVRRKARQSYDVVPKGYSEPSVVPIQDLSVQSLEELAPKMADAARSGDVKIRAMQTRRKVDGKLNGIERLDGLEYFVHQLTPKRMNYTKLGPYCRHSFNLRRWVLNELKVADVPLLPETICRLKGLLTTDNFYFGNGKTVGIFEGASGVQDFQDFMRILCPEKHFWKEYGEFDRANEYPANSVVVYHLPRHNAEIPFYMDAIKGRSIRN